MLHERGMERRDGKSLLHVQQNTIALMDSELGPHVHRRVTWHDRLVTKQSGRERGITQRAKKSLNSTGRSTTALEAWLSALTTIQRSPLHTSHAVSSGL
jgi:hypothetical protein